MLPKKVISVVLNCKTNRFSLEIKLRVFVWWYLSSAFILLHFFQEFDSLEVIGTANPYKKKDREVTELSFLDMPINEEEEEEEEREEGQPLWVSY